MQCLTGVDSHQWEKHTAVTLGKFDGLHRGHQLLVDKIMSYASEGCESVLCAFDMHRESVMTKEERRAMLEGKIDYLIEYPFTGEVRHMEAETFIKEILCDKLHAAHVVVGPDFSFGYGKRGNAKMLQECGWECGFTVDVIEQARFEGRIISSTYIKEALSQGDVALAEKLLGYPYSVTGVVRHGKKLGRTLGFPTMNIEPPKDKILPRFGVYACRVLIDGVWYGGIGNAGVKPTVTDEQSRLLEVYVFGYEGDAYGKTVRAEFCEFERPETRFASVEELKEQVLRDIEFGKTFFKNRIK